MGLSSAPCLVQQPVTAANQVDGVLESASFIQSSLDSNGEEKLASSMNSPKDLQKLQSACKPAMAEHHSYVNLPSSFDVRIANLGYMSIPQSRGVQLRNCKSFHCEGTSPNGSKHPLAGSGGAQTSSANAAVIRHQQHQRKLVERQRIKMLKPLNAATHDGNVKKMCDSNKFSAAVLPDPTTSSYRITNDVSFDEGSRYNGEGTATQFSADRKSTENIQRLKHNSSTESRSSPYNGHGRLEKLSDSPIRDRANHGTPTVYKEAMPMSLVRMEDRVEFDAPLRRHSGHGAFVIPGSRGHSAQAGAHATVPVVASTPAALSLTTFRLQKGKQNWSSRSGDLSVSGGGYYGSSPMQPGARVDMVGMGSLSISPASNLSPKLGPNRERNGTLTKTRVSSRFGCRMDSMGSLVGPAGRDGHYADPCLSAPPSFQQRLMELSMLETETVKYERNRKLKRKKAQDS